MTRLIDANALEKAIYEWMPKNQEEWLDGDLPPIENLVVSIMMTIQEQPTIDAEPHWIPCSERLPKMKEIVLITNDKGHVRCGQYRGVGFFSKNDGRPHWNWKGNTLETVVAWIPLPKPYEVEE